MKSLRESHTEETVAALLRAGRQGFGTRGYAAVGLEGLAAEAGVTTGAIYHHFAGKKGLFLAVAEQIEAELLATALAVADDDPWRRLGKAFATLVEACAMPEVQRIIFLDAPRVIGPEAWREIELRYAYGGLAALLAQLTQAGVMARYPVELVAPVLLSVLAETSRAIAAAPERREEALELMQRVLDSLRRT